VGKHQLSSFATNQQNEHTKEATTPMVKTEKYRISSQPHCKMWARKLILNGQPSIVKDKKSQSPILTNQPCVFLNAKIWSEQSRVQQHVLQVPIIWLKWRNPAKLPYGASFTDYYPQDTTRRPKRKYTNQSVN